MADPTVIILAAGIGSRYGGLKQVDPVGPNGELIVHYSVYDALQAGFRKVVFVIRRDIEEIFRDRVGRAIEDKADVAYVFQEVEDLPAGFTVPPGRTKPWGTGHAVLCCRDVVPGNFAALNADDFYGAWSYKALAEFLRAAQDTAETHNYAVVGYVLSNTLSEHGDVTRGVCQLGPADYLKSVHERRRVRQTPDGPKYVDDKGVVQPLSPDSIVSMNMWGFTGSFFDELDQRFRAFLAGKVPANPLQAEFLLPEIVNVMVQEGKTRVKVLKSAEKWFGITYQADRAQVQAAITGLIAGGQYPSDLA